FTDKGRELLKQILPVWEAITAGMNELEASDAKIAEILPAISALENTFRAYNLSGKVGEKLNPIPNEKL
ncbi:hypothetical protein QN344_00560, partial [Mucilaginibacter sp. 5B2]|nr:hypothetical protein [Mucilaginibacter sp. 5B2]